MAASQRRSFPVHVDAALRQRGVVMTTLVLDNITFTPGNRHNEIALRDGVCVGEFEWDDVKLCWRARPLRDGEPGDWRAMRSEAECRARIVSWARA
jgi:hypothetical protein